MLHAVRTRRGATPFLALAIIALALWMRILVPQGWMPVQNGGGWRLTPCSGTGPMEMGPAVRMGPSMGTMHHHGSGNDQGTGDHACPFSVLALALSEPPPPAVAPPARIAGEAIVRTVAAIGIGQGLAAPPPPATGPPLI